MEAQKTIGDLRQEVFNTKAAMVVLQQQHEFAELQWKAREDSYVQALEKVGQKKLAWNLLHEDDLNRTGLHMDQLNTDPSFRHYDSPTKQKNQELLEKVLHHRQQLRTRSGRSPSPSRRVETNHGKATEERAKPLKTSIVLYADVNARSASPVLPLRAMHVPVSTPQNIDEEAPVALPSTLHSTPNRWEMARTSSFVPKDITKEELEAINRAEALSKVRSTVVFTTDDPNVVLADLHGKKCEESGPGSPVSKEQLSVDRLNQLGHFSVFTTAAAKKMKSPKVPPLKGLKKSFKFTGSI